MNRSLKELIHMRSMMCLPLIAVTLAACQSEGPEPPQNITAAFHRLYPEARITQWNDESPIWEAKYTESDTKGAVSFNANGEVTETELVVPDSALPAAGMVYITEHYPRERVQRCERVTDDRGKVVFEIQITGKELVFDAQGSFLQEEPD